MAMVSRMPIFLCILVTFTFISQSTAQPGFLYHFCMNHNGNYTANSTYHNNLNTLLSNLSSNTQIDYGFYNFSYGQDNERVNAIGLCRGDVKPHDCRNCFNDSKVLLTQLCPDQKEAIGWYDNCMLRYSNRSIFNTMEASPGFYMRNNGNATDIDQFNEVLRNLLDSLIDQASSGDSKRKFAAANVTGPGFQTIYGLVQCTPDLSEQECSACLIGAISEIPQCCDGKKGGRVGRPSCNFRYEIYPFYDATNVATPQTPKAFAPSPSSTDALSTEGKSSTSRTVTVIVVPIIAIIVLVILISIYLRMRRSWKHIEELPGCNSFPVEAENDDAIRSAETLQLDFATIMAATNSFSDEKKLGQGGFGSVYKGTLSNGQEVAVKSGYMAPEYAFHGQFSAKSDVYSFGVLVLEIVSGQNNCGVRRGENVEDLLTSAWKKWREGTPSSIVDPTITDGSRNEIMRCIHIALLCVQENVADRPTMGSVVLMLNSYSATLPLPSHPAFIIDSRSLSVIRSDEYDPVTGRSDETSIQSVQTSVNEASITELFPR
ncbi:hypothetical protein VNO77_12361 [Canavalia gladiata]|uniref:Gnk2-homologous domain-containing protein n=1 Tax=Canavalia gladiata TaxID=3824 RepID=A0AAN9QR20_CANGL